MLDSEIASAMERHYGNGRPWSLIARSLGMPASTLRGIIFVAERRGMKKYRAPKRKAVPVCCDDHVRRLSVAQRARIERLYPCGFESPPSEC